MAKQTVRKRIKRPARLIVQREFIGEKNVKEVMLPIIYEDLRQQMERRTFDKDSESK